MVVGGFVAHVGPGAHGSLDAPLVYGTAGSASHHGRRSRRGRTLLLLATAVVVNVRRVQQRHVRRVTHAESIVAAATARRTVHRCPPHALDDRLRSVIRTRRNGQPVRPARTRCGNVDSDGFFTRDSTVKMKSNTRRRRRRGNDDNLYKLLYYVTEQKQVALITTAAALITMTGTGARRCVAGRRGMKIRTVMPYWIPSPSRQHRVAAPNVSE